MAGENLYGDVGFADCLYERVLVVMQMYNVRAALVNCVNDLLFIPRVDYGCFVPEPFQAHFVVP